MENLISKTNGLKQSTIIPSFFKNDLQSFISYSRELFYPNENGMIQVWVEGVKDEEYFNKIKKFPLKQDQSIEDWVKKIFGDKKFGIIVNRLQNYSLNLCRKTLEYVKPYVDSKGIPSGGFDLALFVGNYGMTPLGIHKDLNGGKVLTFHLGPGDKTIYQWDDDTYERRTGFRGNYIPESPDFLETSDRSYTFSAGDMFFMPENIWHIGQSDQFSMSLTFWFNHYDSKTIYQNIFIPYLRNCLVDKKQTISPFNPDTNIEIQKNKNLFNLELKDRHSHLKVQDLFQDLYLDYQYEMLSNCGFMSPPPILQNQNSQLSESICIIATNPFKLYHRIIGEKVIIYVRGRQIEWPFNEVIVDVIKRINKGVSIEVEDLIKPLLEYWDEDMCIYFVRELYRHKGIEIIE